MSGVYSVRCFFFFFQAEDGIRDVAVTGVQTCALPISRIVEELDERGRLPLVTVEFLHNPGDGRIEAREPDGAVQVPRRERIGQPCELEIGRAACRERV